MSERTASAAVATMLLTDLEDAAFGWEMLALIEAVDFEYERWCRVLKLNADDPKVEWDFYELHQHWAWTWNEFGDDIFRTETTDRVARWRRLLEGKKD